MNEAILVINMPYSCAECPLVYGNDLSDWCYPMGHFNGDVFRHTQDNTKPDWCPLKQMPRMKFTYVDHDDDATTNYNKGWNDCIDKIKYT